MQYPPGRTKIRRSEKHPGYVYQEKSTKGQQKISKIFRMICFRRERSFFRFFKGRPEGCFYQLFFSSYKHGYAPRLVSCIPKSFFYPQIRAMQGPPYYKGPVRAVPETAEEHSYHQVE